MAKGKHQTPRKKPESINRARFLQLLNATFPEVTQAVDECCKGILHFEMGVFATITEAALDQKRFRRVDEYFRFVEAVWERATPAVQNAIHVSYIEDLALGKFNGNRYRGLKRLPDVLREILLQIDRDGRWV
jgi:hypothetical protein